MTAYNYNISPPPTSGSGTPYGRVPGNIGIPPNLYQGISSVYPGLDRATGSVGDFINTEARGELSPETIATIQDEAARFGVTSGMPLSQLSGHRGLRSLGMSVEGLQRQGAQDYNAFLGAVGHTVTDPTLAATIASANAVNNSAPDPAEAARAQLEEYRRSMMSGLNLSRNPGGGFRGMGGDSGRTPLESPGVVVGNSTGGGTVRTSTSQADVDAWRRYMFGSQAGAQPEDDWEQFYNEWMSGGRVPEGGTTGSAPGSSIPNEWGLDMDTLENWIGG